MKEKPRLLWADSLKGWLMVLVILGHAIQTVMPEACFHNHLWNLIYSFHMPAFMAVSGYFAYRAHGNGGGKSQCARRFRQLMVPYVAWSAISFLLSGDYTLERVGKMVLYPDTSFWFLWVLFFINVVFVFCQWVAEKVRRDELLVIGVTCFLLLGIMVGAELRVFGFQFLAYYFVFYTIGYCVHRYPRLQIGNGMMLGALLVIWAVMAWYWNMHELPGWMPMIPHVPSSLLQYAYRGMTALVAILFLMGMAPKALNGTSLLNCGIKEIGVISLGCYTCHLTIMGHVVSLLRNMMPGASEMQLVIFNFVICLCITLFIVEQMKRNRITAKALLGKV